MADFDNNSRVDKFEKRRKNTKSITILLIIGAVLLIILLAIWIFGGGEEEKSTDQAQDSSQNEQTDDRVEDDGSFYEKGSTDETDKNQEDDSSSDNAEEDADEKEDEQETLDKQQVESSDENVANAYTADWQPIGTEQEGPHTTDYNDGSQDRIEINKAVSMATGVSQEEMVTYWVGNGGEQKVIATISTADKSEIYRVYLSWIDNEGWKPTKVEELKTVQY